MFFDWDYVITIKRIFYPGGKEIKTQEKLWNQMKNKLNIYGNHTTGRHMSVWKWL